VKLFLLTHGEEDDMTSRRLAPSLDSLEPTRSELCEIEAEWPLIEAELALVEAEIAALQTGEDMSPLEHRRLRRATSRQVRVMVEASRVEAWLDGAA
jgi:hypothetical protein